MKRQVYQLTAISTLAHCISANSDYDMADFPIKHMQRIAKEYRLLQAEIARNPDALNCNPSVSPDSLDKIRDRLIELGLILP